MGSQEALPLLLLELLVPPVDEDEELLDEVFPELVLVDVEDEVLPEVDVELLFEELLPFPPPEPKGRLSSLPSAQLVSAANGSAMARDNKTNRDMLRVAMGRSPRFKARFRRS